MTSPSTVVVIGAGPTSPQLRAADIDIHPVVRMWNHEWQPTDRYGSRFDYGVITTTQDARDAVRAPARSWFFYNVPHEQVSSGHLGGAGLVVLDNERWFRRAVALGAKSGSRKALKFTRGFAAVAAVIEHVRPERILVVGMDVLRTGATGVRYYDPAALPWYVRRYPQLAVVDPQWAADEMPPGLPRLGPHDFSAEAVLIRQLAAEAGIEIVWDS
jgi:hypothetical protein